jgi:hypothetical protein
MVSKVRQIWKVVQNRRHKWMGHVFRHDEFVVNIIEGRRVEAQGRGRPWKAYINQIMDFTGCNNYQEMKAWAHDRDKRREIANQSPD